MAKHVVLAGWDDVPEAHLDSKTKETLYKSIPIYQRDARSKGIPQLGSGAIYPVPESEITVPDFQLPSHYPRGYGFDVGWNRCLAKDSMVLMPDGTQKAIQNIVVGEEVLAFDFKTEGLLTTKVVDTFKGYADNMVTVGASKYQTITCTDDHPFAHRAQPHDEIKFKKVADIKGRIRAFQSVVLPNRWDVVDEKEVCSPEMARVIGYLLGDGCLTYKNRRLEFAQTIDAYTEDMRGCLQATGCDMNSYNNNSMHHLKGIKFRNNVVLGFVRELGLLGKTSIDKFIPPRFFTATKDIIENLLVGLIHTDGSVEGDNIRYYTVSKQLAEGVQTLCLRLGIYASLSCDTRRRKPTHNPVFRVTLRRPTSLPLMSPKKLLPTRPERKKRTDRLLNVYEEAPPQDIYCITVEHPDHAFVCNRFVVSNTAAIWGALDRDTDILYLYSEHYKGEAEPVIHATSINARGKWIPGRIDPAARGRGQRDGEQLLRNYIDLGLKLETAVNAVESGIYKVWERMSTGRLKVFKSLGNFFSEFRIYRRDEKGKIVKENDHLLDSCRYLVQECERTDFMIIRPPVKKTLIETVEYEV